MKKRHIAIVLYFISFVALRCMEYPSETTGKRDGASEAEEKVPSLKKLTAQKLAHSIEIASDEFWELDPVIQQHIIAAKGALSFTHMRQLIKGYDEKTQKDQATATELFLKDTINTIITQLPATFLTQFNTCTVELAPFINWITGLSSAIRERIKAAFAAKIRQFYAREFKDTHIPLKIITEKGKEYILPIDFRLIGGALTGGTLTPKVSPILHAPNYFIPLFIGQQLQLDMLDTIRKQFFDFGHPSDITQLSNYFKVILEKIADYKQLNPHLKSYIALLQEINSYIRTNKIDAISALK